MRLYVDKLRDTQEFIIECVQDYIQCNKAIVIRKTPNGKPYIDNLDIEISVSHSDEYIVLAIDKDPIGVDIERIRNRDYISMAERFYTNEEALLVKDKGIQSFYELWTMKEAYCKLMGINLNTRIDKEFIACQGHIIDTAIYYNDYIVTTIHSLE